MSRDHFGDDKEACVLCFWGKRRCRRNGGSCYSSCSGIVSDQKSIKASSGICDDEWEAHIDRMFQSSSMTMKRWLAFDSDLPRKLICRFASKVRGQKQCIINFVGAFCAKNLKLVDSFDKMILDRCSLEIETNHEALSSTTTARLCIGYINMAFWAQLPDKSNSADDTHNNFTAAFVQLIFIRIDDLVSTIMELVRYEDGHDGPESRSGVYLLYLYLVGWYVERKKMDCFTIFNDGKLFQHVRERLNSLAEELKARLKIDCKNRIPWADEFKCSKNDIRKTLRVTKECKVSLDIVSSPMNSVGSNFSALETAGSSISSLRLGGGDTNMFRSHSQAPTSPSNHSSGITASSRDNTTRCSGNYLDVSNGFVISDYDYSMSRDSCNPDIPGSNGSDILDFNTFHGLEDPTNYLPVGHSLLTFDGFTSDSVPITFTDADFDTESYDMQNGNKGQNQATSSLDSSIGQHGALYAFNTDVNYNSVQNLDPLLDLSDNMPIVTQRHRQQDGTGDLLYVDPSWLLHPEP